MKKPIVIKETRDGMSCHGPAVIWRAYGVNDFGRLFWLVDNRYPCAYPLDASTEKQVRHLCERQYPGHPILTGKEFAEWNQAL